MSYTKFSINIKQHEPTINIFNRITSFSNPCRILFGRLRHILMSCHLTSCHLMSCHLMSCHLMSCHLTSSYVLSSHVLSSHVLSSYVMSSYFIQCHIMLCHVNSCHVMSSLVMSFLVMTYFPFFTLLCIFYFVLLSQHSTLPSFILLSLPFPV